MRYAPLLLILLASCAGSSDDDNVQTGISAPFVTTDPAETALSTEDIAAVIELGSEGPGEITYDYAWSSAGQTWTQATLPATATVKGETWTVTVTPYSGDTSGPPGSASITILNAPPVLSGVSFDPAAPAQGSPLTCVADASDPDGDSLTYAYRWEINGADAGEASDTLPAEAIVPGVTIGCAVTASDGEYTTDEILVTAALDNAPPTVDGATIVPPSPLSTQDATCIAGTGVDPEGATVSFTYAWYINGTAAGVTDATLTADRYSRDDQILCVVTPSDGLLTGSSVNSPVATVRNSGPSVDAIEVTPPTPRADSTLQCSATATDPDNDNLTLSYQWFVNGLNIGEASELLFPGSIRFQDYVYCQATASDGEYEATAISDFVVVTNTPPLVAGLSITPNPANATQGLSCAHTSTSDADGDTVTVSYAWTVNGSPVGAGSTLAAGSAVRGQTVACEATPNDGTSDGPPISTSIVLGNAPPGQPALSIDPAAPTESDDVSCVATATDPDGDLLTYTYAWYVGTTLVSSTEVLPAGTVARGELARCEATAADGTDTGPLATLEITPGNQIPSIDSVTLDPSSALSGDNLTCTATATDGDGDPLTTSYAWTRNGVSLGVTTATLDGGAVSFVYGDVLVCQATVQDEFSSVSASSNPLTVGNTPPTLAGVTISPPAANTSQALTCYAGTTTDPDGQAVSATFEWFVDGASAGAGATLSAYSASRGQVARCVAVPSDGVSVGDAVEASITIGNAPPGLPAVSVGPAGAHGGDTLVCVAIATDPDNDGLTYDYTWFVNNEQVATGGTLPANSGIRGDSVRCEARADDGTTTGAMGQSTLVLANQPPAITSITVDPSPSAGPTAPIQCIVASEDRDGDSLTTTYEWIRNGSNAGVDSAQWSGTLAVGDTLACRATVEDDQYSDTRTATAITISNSLPQVSGVTITPASPTTDRALVCGYESLTDPDGQTLTAGFRWVIDGATAGTTSTLAAGTPKGKTVTCEVTPNDGVEDGPTGSAAVVIINSPPSYTGASITPATGAVEGSTLVCSAAGEDDADNDPVTPRYQWFRGSNAIAGATTARLEGADFSRGDSVTCQVTPDDGEEIGTPVVSPAVAIGNTAPTGGTVSIDPPTATTVTSLSCDAGGATDVDGDPVSYTFAWKRNGTTISSQTGTTLPADQTAKGQSITCTATPTDGTDSGTTLTSSAVVIDNTAPTGGTAVVTPPVPTTDDDLLCSASGATDVDGDPVSYDYAWRENGTTLSGQTDSTLLAAATSFGRTYSCVATPKDGEDSGSPIVSNTVSLGNSAPEGGTATLSPPTAYTDTVLTCTGSGATDPDGDPVTYDITWQRNGSRISGEVGTTLPIAQTAKGQSITCEVTPTDGTDNGIPVLSNPVEILNSVPSGAEAAIDPPVADTTDTLTCVASGATDADSEDTVSYTYRWFRGGSVINNQTSRTLAANQTSKGQSITCEATPFDGTQSGSPATSAAVVIRNSAPTGGSATLNPPNPSIEDDLICEASGATDDDGDNVTYTYAWREGSVTISGQTNAILPASLTSTGNTYTCVVTPTDGTTSGTSFNSNSVSIGNSAPTGGTASLGPEPAYANTQLICTGSGAVDPDGDQVSYLYTWFRAGQVIAGQVSDRLDTSLTAKNQSITCQVTPTDGTDNGVPALSNAVVIQNSAPSGASASVAPSSPKTGDTLTCTGSGATDLDGDNVTYTWRWRRNGTVLNNETGQTLSSGQTSKGQTIACEATPTDGTASGAAAWSSNVTIQNTAPTLTSTSIDTSTAYFEASTISCSASGGSDADNDSLTYQTRWYVNGSTEVNTTQLTGADFDKGDEVACEMRAYDGSAYSGWVSSNAVTIRNTPPVATSASVSPATAYETSTLTCPASASDDDNDGLTYEVTWTINASTSVVSANLTGLNFDKDDSVFCEVRAWDGSAYSNPVSSGAITIRNSTPSITGATLTPSSPTASSTMICGYTGPSDADSDNLTYSWRWYRNGALISGQGSSTLSGQLAYNDSVYCEVRPYDGSAYGAWKPSPTRTVQNSPPVIESISVAPNPAYASSTLSCDANVVEPDGQGLSVLIYRWYVNGEVVQEGSDPKLAGAFVRGNSVWCEVYAEDPAGASTEESAEPIVIQNTAPVMGTVTLFDFNYDWRCVGTGTDADNDPLTYATTWQQWTGIRYVTVGSGTLFTPTLGEEYRCGREANDGNATSGFAFSESVLCDLRNCEGILAARGAPGDRGRTLDDLGEAITLTFDPLLDRECEIIVDVSTWRQATESWHLRWSGATLERELALDGAGALQADDRLEIEVFGCEDELHEVAIDGEWVDLVSRTRQSGTVPLEGLSFQSF